MLKGAPRGNDAPESHEKPHTIPAREAHEMFKAGEKASELPPGKKDHMKINSKGLDILKQFEGLRLKAYQDSVGVWTIGYGETRGVKPGMVITEAEAEEMLKNSLEEFEAGVAALTSQVHVTDNQFSSLVVFAYNVGLGNLKSSTLLRKLNLGDFKGAADEFLRWDKAGGQKLAGLTRRREAERALFLSA
jgi:lysozyme